MGAFQGPISGRSKFTLLGRIPSGVTSTSGRVRRASRRYGDGDLPVQVAVSPLVFQCMQNGGIPIWSALQDG